MLYMSKAMYIGVNGAARKVKKMYVGVDGVARKVKKAYVGVNGVARQFYSSAVDFSYSGDYQNLGLYTVNGKDCTLYRLTSSGELRCDAPFDVWMCGGGGKGAKGYSQSYATGGGAGGYVASGTLQKGKYTAIVGSAGGASSIGSISANKGNNAYQRTGGSGGSGGGGEYNYAGKGAGVSTLPFGIYSLKYHSAGGGGGYSTYKSGGNNYSASGCDGGSNGSDGKKTRSGENSGTYKEKYALGGEYGGGNGSFDTVYTVHVNGSAGVFYGAGGGGGAYNNGSIYDGYTGYQGCIYIAVPN